MARLRETMAVALVATFGCEVADFDVERGGIATIPHDRMGDTIEMMRLDDTKVVLAELDIDATANLHLGVTLRGACDHM